MPGRCRDCVRSALGWREGGVDASWDACWIHSNRTERAELSEALQGGAGKRARTLVDANLVDFDFEDAAICNVHFEGGVLWRVQFRDAVLSDVQFVRTDLGGADFTGAHLENTKFEGATLKSADFGKTHLSECKFVAAMDGSVSDLSQTSFRRAYLQGVQFEARTALREATLQAASLKSVEFVDCDGECSDLQNLRGEGVTFNGGSFRRSFFADSVFVAQVDRPVFEDVELEGGDFRRITIGTSPGRGEAAAPASGTLMAFDKCRMANCDFGGAQLNDCTFRGGSAESCSFEDASLAKARFEGIDLVASVFSNAYMQETVFQGTENALLNLTLARFRNAVLQKAVLTHVCAKAANLAACLLDSCTLESCGLESAVLDQAVVRGTDLRGEVNFSDASLAGSSFEGCTMDGTVFRDARLNSSTFRDVRWTGKGLDFTGADLSDSDLRGAEFKDCIFARTIFANAMLRGAKLARGKFDGARFSDCDLIDVDAEGASFRGASLLDCNVMKARFRGVSFASANLSGTSTLPADVTLDQAVKQGVIQDKAEGDGYAGGIPWKEGGRTDFRGCDFFSAEMTNCVLVGADFSGAETNLKRAVFRGSDLRAATFSQVHAEYADFSLVLFGEKPSAGDGRIQKDGGNAPVLGERLTPALMRGLHAEGAGFAGAELAACDLTGATLDQARLDNATVCGAIVTNCTFHGASLIGVIDFNRVEGLKASEKIPDFSYAYIQATPAILEQGNKWGDFRSWINGGARPSGEEEKRRLSWVAWKNDFESLGLYAEQSECFREEQIAGGWARLHRLPWVVHGILFGLGLLGILLILGAAYDWSAREFGPEVPFWVGLGILVGGSIGIFWKRRAMFVRRVILLLMDVVYGFGEQPVKALANTLLVVLVFALSYWLAVARSWGSFEKALTVSGEYLYFSIVTFTTLGYGDLMPREFCRFLSNCESLVGVAMVALFIHALARRTAGR